MTKQPSDDEWHTHVPGNPDIGDIEDWLNERFGGRWMGLHAEASQVPETALYAQFRQNESGYRVLTGLMLLGDALTADKLRAVPLASLENSQNLSGDAKFRDEFRAAIDALPPLERAAGMSPEDFSRLVAEHYNVWARFVPHPAAAMAAELGAKVPTVHTWIREARLRGFLPPAKRGKGKAR